MKTIKSKFAPNPKEAQIWIDLSADPHGTVYKYWNGMEWITKDNDNISKEEIIETLKPQFDDIKNQFINIESKINSLNNYCDKYILTLIKNLTDRITKLEQIIVME